MNKEIRFLRVIIILLIVVLILQLILVKSASNYILMI